MTHIPIPLKRGFKLKKGVEFRIEGGTYTPPACSLIFFSGRGTRVYLEGGMSPPVVMYVHTRGLMRRRNQGHTGPSFREFSPPNCFDDLFELFLEWRLTVGKLISFQTCRRMSV